MKLDDKQLEKLLTSLPKLQISEKADKKFYAKLNALARERFFEEETSALTAPSFFNFLRPTSLRLGLVGAFASLLLVVGGTVWAYQPSTTRGKLMYPWKQTAEKVELAFAFSDMQKVDTHLQFSDRRLEEAQNIVGKSSSLALLLQTAFADEGEVELTGEEQKNLEATLEDMRSEVTKAGEIVETRVTAPEKAKLAIARIENASNQHIETLNNLERRAAKKAKTIIRLVADDADERLTAVMQAREEINQALEKREQTVKLIINMRRERLSELKNQFNDESRQHRLEEVRQNFTETMQRFEVMPLDVKQEFTAEIEKAKTSLEMGRFGMAEGLSRVMEMREMRFKLQPEPKPEPEFLPADQPQSQSQPGDKPTEPFNPDFQPVQPFQPQQEIKPDAPFNSDAKPALPSMPIEPKKPFQPMLKEQQDFSKLPDEKPSHPIQPKPALINKNEPADFQQPNPNQQKPQDQLPPPMPKNDMLNTNKGMERVDNLMRGLQEAGNFVESK